MYKPEGNGLVSNEVIGFFNRPNISSRYKVLNSTQPLTERGRSIMPTTSPPYVSCLSRKCGILDVSQPYRPPWPAVGIVVILN
jgi:hypothetical protein